MTSIWTRIRKSSIVILSVLYYTFFPLLHRPLNNLISLATSQATAADYYKYIIGYILCEQCLLFLLHSLTPGWIVIVAAYAAVFDYHYSVAEVTVRIDILRNLGVLFLARDISRSRPVAVSGSGSGSGAKAQSKDRSSSSSSSSWSTSNSRPRLDDQYLLIISCSIWLVLFTRSVWFNISSLPPHPSTQLDSDSIPDPRPEISLLQLSDEQFQIVWLVFFARIVLAIPWRSIVLGVKRDGEVRMMIYNTREKKDCGVEGCGFGWDEDEEEEVLGREDEGEGMGGERYDEVLEGGEKMGVDGVGSGVKDVSVGKGEEEEKKKKKKKGLFWFSCNLNLILVALGTVAMIVNFGWEMGWAFALARGIVGYLS
ncbi:hypothetical protein ONS96_001210 [Cadophora gregata f. sp. sojae]|nr:hypothetical protein ONS96_001210 [Cadophora gregata f. sp. sojae]